MLAGEGVFASAAGMLIEAVGGASRRIRSGEDIAIGFFRLVGSRSCTVVSTRCRRAAMRRCLDHKSSTKPNLVRITTVSREVKKKKKILHYVYATRVKGFTLFISRPIGQKAQVSQNRNGESP